MRYSETLERGAEGEPHSSVLEITALMKSRMAAMLLFVSLFVLILFPGSGADDPAFGQDNHTSNATPSPPKVVRKPSVLLQAEAKRRVKPKYPRLALAEEISGEVIVEVTINEEGKVASARALSGNPVLKDAAIEAARLWTFKPTRLSGVPVKVIGTLTFSFSRFDSIEKEIEYYRKKAKQAPEWAQPHSKLGQAYKKARRYEDAIKALGRALTLNPNLIEGHYHLGCVYLEQGRIEEATASLRRAVELSPSHPLAHQKLGVSYSRSGRHEDALKALKESLRLDPDMHETELHFGQAYFRAGQYAEALEMLKKAAAVWQLQTEAHLWLGLTHLRMGNREAAMREYRFLEGADRNAAQQLLREIEQNRLEQRDDGPVFSSATQVRDGDLSSSRCSYRTLHSNVQIRGHSVAEVWSAPYDGS